MCIRDSCEHVREVLDGLAKPVTAAAASTALTAATIPTAPTAQAASTALTAPAAPAAPTAPAASAAPSAPAAPAAPTAPATDLPDFSVFRGAPLQQKHLLASAARQKLRKGNEQDGYYVKSYHLLDEEQGCGAALCFEAVNRGPDYGTQTVAAEGVYFYRFNYPILFDYIPESRRCDPRELPEAFVKRAFVAFSGAAGLRRAKKP